MGEEGQSNYSERQRGKKEAQIKGNREQRMQKGTRDNNFGFLKNYVLKIEKHTIVDEKSPFVLYALEVQSEYSKFVMLK